MAVKLYAVTGEFSRATGADSGIESGFQFGQFDVDAAGNGQLPSASSVNTVHRLFWLVTWSTNLSRHSVRSSKTVVQVQMYAIIISQHYRN